MNDLPNRTIQFSKTLFKLHTSGKVGDYLVQVHEESDGTALLIRTATKIIGGAPNETITHIKVGKNIGRSNETTPVEQAISEAQTKINSQLKKGYVESLEETSKPVTNQLGQPLPMLATPIDKVKNITYPCAVQAKLNGYRLLAAIVDSKVLLYSREGSVVNMPHIDQALQNLFDKGHWDGKQNLDGELFRPGWTLENIGRKAKKLRPESIELGFYVYDTMDTAKTAPERTKYINDIFTSAAGGIQHIVMHPTYIAFERSDIDTLHQEFVSHQFEGTIIRQLHENYVGKRSTQLIKLKTFHDAEFTIVGWKLGKPRIKPEKTYQTPIWVCETLDGEQFDCTVQGSMIEKDAFYEKGLDRFLGKLLTVQYCELSEKGVPPHGVALGFKETL